MELLNKEKYDWHNEIFYCLYLYDVSGELQNDVFFETILSFCREIKLPLKTISWYDDLNDKDFTLSIANFHKRNLAVNNQSILILYSSFIQRYVAESFFYCDNDNNGNTIFFKIAKSVLDSLSMCPKYFYEQILYLLSQKIDIPYGIYYYSSHKNVELDKYPDEITVGKFHQNENINNWYFNLWGMQPPYKGTHTVAPNLHLKGLFRCIYELNIISKLHLNQKIEGITLEKWINKGNGNLKKIGNQYLWIIQKGEIERIQNQLEKANCIIGVDSWRWE